MDERDILLEIGGDIGVIRLNRPDHLNVLNRSMLQELEAAMDRVVWEADVKVVVLTSSSPKAFAAGADILELAEQDPSSGEAFSRSGHGLILKMKAMKKAMIAAVNGYCLGGGLELALACDFIYASDRAQFGMPEVTIGTIPGFGGTQSLRDLIGLNRARELIFSGRLLSAREALDWGIVNRMVPEPDLMAEVMKTARTIAGNSLAAIAFAKQAITSGSTLNQEDALRLESSLFAQLCGTEERRNRMLSFLDKRKSSEKPRRNGRGEYPSAEHREERSIGNGI